MAVDQVLHKKLVDGGLSPSAAELLLETFDASVSRPQKYGFLAWNYDVNSVSASTALTPAGTIFGSKITVPNPILVTNLHLSVGVAGSGLTAGQCFTALHNQSGTLLGTSADQATAWASTGLKTAAIAGGSIAIDKGEYFVTFFYNGTTGPSIVRNINANATIVNGTLSATNSRYFTADTGRTTTMPATLGALTATGNNFWVGLS